jgi:hypothetical protein
MWMIKANEGNFILIVDGEEYPFHHYNELLAIIEINNIENGIEILNLFMLFCFEPEWICYVSAL